MGERKQLVSLFTAEHGRHAGILARTKKTTPLVQCGGCVKARWGARLESHVGQWTFEPLSAPSAFLLETPGPLAALVSAAKLCHLSLPERHSYPSLFKIFQKFIWDLQTAHWLKTYVFFEVSLLEELGYGLNLKACAVTGTTENLVAVSPRTGRAVCAEVALPYQDRLLPLAKFLCDSELVPSLTQIEQALALTGYFLERHLLGRALPPALSRLVWWIEKEKVA